MSDSDRGGYAPLSDDPTYDAADRQDARGRGPFLISVAMVVLAAFLGIVYVAYQQGVRQGQQMNPPLIVAEPGPVRVEPEDPGGFEEPYQDMFVLNGNGEETEGLVETLLPPPEEPMERPVSAEEIEAAGAVTPESEILEIPAAPGGGEAAADAVEAPPPAAPAPEPDTAAAETPSVTAPVAMPPPVALSGEDDAAALPPPAPDSAGVAPASGLFVVQVAAVPGPEQALERQNDIRTSHEAILIGLDFDIQGPVVVDRRTFYRVRIGPFDTRPQAVDLCEALKARGQDCFVTTP